MLPIIQSGALELGVIELEAERLDQVQAVARVAAQRRATLPVLGGISGSTKTIFTSIKNLPQHQAVRGGGHAGGAAVLFVKYLFDRSGAIFPCPTCTSVPTMPRHIL
jgi:hypothetical protein